MAGAALAAHEREEIRVGIENDESATASNEPTWCVEEPPAQRLGSSTLPRTLETASLSRPLWVYNYVRIGVQLRSERVYNNRRNTQFAADDSLLKVA